MQPCRFTLGRLRTLSGDKRGGFGTEKILKIDIFLKILIYGNIYKIFLHRKNLHVEDVPCHIFFKRG